MHKYFITTMSYDAFISYRRGNGFYTAQVIRDHLTKENINCFLDVEELHSGKFDHKILDAIKQAPNFIIILTKDSLDKCANEGDWMRREIAEALQNHKTIIPIICEDFRWPQKWDDNIPDCIRSLETYQAVPSTKVYLYAMIEKVISYMSGVDHRVKKKENQESVPIIGSLRLATSGLTVIDSIMQGWDCDLIFRRNGFTIDRFPYKWSDKILTDMEAGKLDIAIYNKESCLSFNKNNGGSIHIVRDICSSMGGRNFYILASKNGKWRNMTLEQFKQSIDSDTIIGVPKHSDMYKNLLFILDISEEEIVSRGVKIIDYHSDQGLELFKILPDLLIVAGQDIRFLAECIGDYFELISYDYFPQEKKNYFFKNSINSLIISNSAMSKLKNINIEQLGIDLMLNFYRNFMKKDSTDKIYGALVNKLSHICHDEETLKYIINKILFETYRFI